MYEVPKAAQAATYCFGIRARGAGRPLDSIGSRPRDRVGRGRDAREIRGAWQARRYERESSPAATWQRPRPKPARRFHFLEGDAMKRTDNPSEAFEQRIAYENECIGDLKAQFIKHPQTQHKARFSAADAAGSTALGFWRGRHAGLVDAHDAISKKYPKAAAALRAEFGFDVNGVISGK